MEDEITPTEEVVEETETIDSTNDEEQDTDEPEVVTLEDYHKTKAAKDKLYQRAKKAEQELKALKAQGSKPLNNNSSGLTRDEAILIAKGVPEEVINEASDIAKAKGITLSEAMKTPIVTAFIANLKQAETKEKAQLSSSASGAKSSKGDLMQAVGMTEEEHRKALGM